MNWSDYSRFVGDVFGAPLAMEGLAAFFLESTFLGLWLFGWNVLPRGVHLATAWLVALGSAGSAAFIMAANSWMQHPVGYTTNPTTGRPAAVLDRRPVHQPGVRVGLPARAAGVAGHRRAGDARGLGVVPAAQRRTSSCSTARRSCRLIVLLPAILVNLGVGSHLGVIEATYQPMKIAAAEAQWTTCQPCSFSAFQIGGGNRATRRRRRSSRSRTCCRSSPPAPGTARSRASNELNAQYQQQYGPGDYVPNVFIQYWSMRVMAYLGSLVALLALWGGWLLWRRRLDRLAGVPVAGDVGGRDAVPDEHRRLDAHRERPPAVDRAGADADQGRRLAVGEHDRGRASAWSCSTASTSCSASSTCTSCCATRAAGSSSEPERAATAPDARVPALTY